ncbi:hypothetical protein K438DRAFT_1961303 [Mycena galopus ATCC 62051]|nr:hypothetical protein K438DRAFT_1961303 [Mycena galopus ATCC 62051]
MATVFPPELEREIFETAAFLDPGVIPTLLLVARRVLIWIEPLLYTVVCTSSHPSILNATKSKSSDFFHNAVRHLFLDGISTSWTAEEATDLLRLCTGVVNLGAIGKFSNPSLLPILARMKVQRMAGSLDVLFGDYQSIDLTHQAFSYITHIDIFDEIVSNEPRISEGLAALPALTHLCLNNDVPLEVLEKSLTDCLRLELLVVLFPLSSTYGVHEWLNKIHISDMRFLAGVFRDYWDDWEKGARGLPDFWTAADAFVAQKRCGAIAADRFLFNVQVPEQPN